MDTDAYRILQSLNSVKGVRLSVVKSFWPETHDLEECPEGADPSLWTQGRLLGTISKWGNVKEGLLRIEWYDMMQTNSLSSLLEDGRLRFERFADGRPAPVSRGAGARGTEERQLEEESQVYKSTFTIGSLERELVWTRIPKEGVKVDARVEPNFPPVINRSPKEYATPYEMWRYICLPKAWLDRLVKYANQRLDGSSRKKRKTTAEEWERFCLYMGALSLVRGVPIEDAWEPRAKEGSIAPALDLGRFGMSQQRFKKLRSLAGKAFDVQETEMDVSDSQRYYGFWADEWNEHMQDVLTPGWLLSPDESMAAYTGKEGVDALKGTQSYKSIDHLDFVPRKPEPLGKEVKTMCDGESGAFIRIEVQRPAEAHQHQEWYASWGHTTAQCLRLVKPWLSSKKERVFAADSWFSGIRTSEAIFTMSGGKMFTVGDVKINTSGFPKKEFMAAVPEGNGQWATFSSVLEGIDHPDHKEMKMWAVAHRRGGAVHCFIFTAGTSLMGNPMKHTVKEDDDGGSDYIIARECPKVLNDYTKAQPATDCGNRNRQHLLAMEKRFVTRCFPFRFFTFMLGLTFVNVEALSKYFMNTQHKRKTFLELIHEVCEDGLNALSPFKTVKRVAKRRPDYESSGDSSDSPDGHGPPKTYETCDLSPHKKVLKHTLAPLSMHIGIGGRQMDCGECGKRAGYFCVGCSTEDVIVPLHPEFIGKKKYDCFSKHMRHPNRAHRARPRGARPKHK